MIPSGARDESFAANLINARSESVDRKPTFAPLFLGGQRCLVPANAYYEFPEDKYGKKAVKLDFSDGRIFAMAGLVSTWRNPDSGDSLATFTILTCPPNSLIQPERGDAIHDRMPVILNERDEKIWLSHETKIGEVKEILKPCSAKKMRAVELSDTVKNPRNEGESCWATPDRDFDWLNRD